MSETPSALERAAAANLVKTYLRVQPGENVIVEAWDHTLSMSSAVVDAVRQIGGKAFLAYENDDAWWRAVERKQAKALGSLSGPEWAAVAAADVYVQFWGPADSARLERLGDEGLDPWAEGWFDRWYKLARSTGLRGGRMAAGWITDSRARHWGVNKERWRRALLEACLSDPDELAKGGHRLARALTGKKRVRITHPNGTDLEVALAGAPAMVYEGHPHPRDKAYSQFDLMSDLPDGRVRVALDAKTAEGRIVSNRRSYDEVWFPWTVYSGATLEFAAGKLTSFAFDQGGAQFAKRYRKGTTGKDRTGSLTLGLHPHIKNVPYAEGMERGSVQLFLGGNSYLGGNNPSDFRAAVCLAGAEISVEGVPMVRSGGIL